MQQPDFNEIFTLAADIVRNTSQTVFLTGKAGTGKTTFLHYIRNHTDKNVVVAAPTGVAAINAGGVTLHSLLQLPFEPFIPNDEGRKKLDYHFKLRKAKIEMLRELDLLIIDEVSMLRADMVDAIDHMLRRYRNPYEPFGGVQILFIGDLFQLPPVVQSREWEDMKQYYASPFFFHAQALNNRLPLYVELKKIYRQSDQRFIDILNRIRNNQTTTEDLDILNEHYNPNFKPSEQEGYVTLCTHNYKADKINNEELAKLKTPAHSFNGQVKGDFAENALPAEKQLMLKEGAQVMFVRNEAGEKRRYYNGKLAVISHLDNDKIFVRFRDGSEMQLELETWRNVRYVLNRDSGEIEEDELGTYTQFPVRLAWAITIHKSQGLTFDRVAIDAGQAFAGGQVYVALSRCTTLDGVVLFSRITQQSIQTDPEAIRFTREEKPLPFLQEVLVNEKPRYTGERLKRSFEWAYLVHTMRSFYELVEEKKIPNKEEIQSMASLMCNRAAEQEEIAYNFRKELDQILNTPQADINRLKDRVQKAVSYFHKDIQAHIALPLLTHIDSLKNAAKIKLYLERVREIYKSVEEFIEKLEHIHYGDIDLTGELIFDKPQIPEQIESSIPEKEKKKKAEKGDSQRLTLSLFNEGKNLKEIAEERNLSTTTVEGHLATFVGTGDLTIDQLMEEEKLARLKALFQSIDPQSGLSAIKSKLPKEYTFFDIKLMLNYITISKL